MWLRKIQKKKKQYILIAIIVMFSTAILSGCLSFVLGMDQCINDFFADCTDACTYVYKGEAVDSLEKAIAENKNVELQNSFDVGLIEGPIKEKNKLSKPFYMTVGVLDNYKKMNLCMNIDKGEIKTAPKDDEIWIDSIYANDKKLDIGDTLEINKKKLKISAIYRSAFRTSSLNSLSTVYCNQKTYQKIVEKLKPMKGYCLKYTNMSQEEKNSFLSDHVSNGAKLVLCNFTKNDLMSGSKMMVLLIGGMGSLASVLIFIAAIVVISFVIKNSIYEEYRTIGIHKALGDTNRVIQGFYIKSYLFVGGIGIFIGALSGIPLGNILQTNFAKYMQNPKINATMIFTSLLCGVGLWLVLMLSLFITLRKVKKITPVEAIRMGMTSSKKRNHRSLIRNANSSFTVAVNEIVKKRANSIMMLLLLTLSVYLSLFFVTMRNSSVVLAENSNLWFAIPKADATITGDITDSLIKDIKNSKYVSSLNQSNLFQNMNVEADDVKATKEFKEKLSNICTMNCDNWATKESRVEAEQGRMPVKRNEIAMGVNILKDSGYKIGDYIKMRVNNVSKTFLITGTVNSMMNYGNAILFPNTIYEDIGMKGNVFTENFVNLKNNKDYGKFKKEITSKHDGVVVERVAEAIESCADGVVAMVEPVSMILVIVFLIFSITNIIILLELEQQNNRRQFGILKALGRTNGYLCRKMFWKVGLLSVIAIGIGMVLNRTISGTIFKSFVSVNGIVENTMQTFAIAGLLAVVIIVITGMFCIPLCRISPKELMEE